MGSFFLVQWTEANHTDLWFVDASYTKCLDLTNKLEHSDIDHCIKKTDRRQSPKQISSILTHQFCSRHVLYGKFIARNKMFSFVKRRNFQKTRLKFLFPFSI